MAELPVECFIDNDEEVLRLHDGGGERASTGPASFVCTLPGCPRVVSDAYPSKVPCMGHHLAR